MSPHTVRVKRKLEHAQAVLLGFEFKQVNRSSSEDWRGLPRSQLRWVFTVPPHIIGMEGWKTGFFKWRHEAVTAALTRAGVL